MNNHTPGPWHLLPNRNYQKPEEWCVSGPSFGGPLVAVSPRHQGPDAKPDVYQANARLIAAAPELLEALVRLAYVHYGPGWADAPAEAPANPRGKAFRLARAAIAKVRGEALVAVISSEEAVPSDA